MTGHWDAFSRRKPSGNAGKVRKPTSILRLCPFVVQIDRFQQSSGSLVTPNAMAIGAYGSSGAAMEAAVLLHNLTRIIQVCTGCRN